MAKGKQKTEAWLARQLRPFGPQPRTIWIGGVSARGYLLEDLMEEFRRYLVSAELQGACGYQSQRRNLTGVPALDPPELANLGRCRAGMS
jgi:hypothetical protein